MRKSSGILSFSTLICLAIWLGPAATPSAEGQTVLLPTFRTFTINGSVRVPDGGSMFLGGVKSHAEGSVSRGLPILGNVPGAGRLFKNRAIGRESGASNSRVHAQIIIMEELEQEVLAEAARRQAARGGVNADVQRKAQFLSKHMGKSGSKTDKSRHGKRR